MKCNLNNRRKLYCDKISARRSTELQTMFEEEEMLIKLIKLRGLYRGHFQKANCVIFTQFYVPLK